MPSLYDQLITARAVAYARLHAFEKEGTALLGSLLSALRAHMGCTEKELHTLAMSADDARELGGTLTSPGFALGHEGLFAIFVLEFGKGDRARLRCTVRPEKGGFSVTTGNHTMTMASGDNAAISSWCSIAFKRFLEVATETQPMRI